MGTRHTTAYLHTQIGLVTVAAAAFAVSAVQSLLNLASVPNAVTAVAFGVPFVAGLTLGWRGLLAALLGCAAWLAVELPPDGWMVLLAAALESAAGVVLADRTDTQPLTGGSLAAGVRGAAVGALLAGGGHDSWLIAAAATVGLGTVANVVLASAARDWLAPHAPGHRLIESAVVHARDAIIVLEAEPTRGPGRSVLFVNAAFTHMTGYTVEEVVGRSLHFLRGSRSCPATLKLIKEALDHGTPLQAELLNYRKDGSELWVDLSLVPVRDDAGRLIHWVMIQRDACGRKKAEEELRDSEQRLRVLGDNLPDGAVCQVIAEPGGPPRFKYVSAGIQLLTGLDAKTLMDNPHYAHSLVHPEDQPRFTAAGGRSQAEQTPFDCEFRFCQPDGSVKWVHARSQPQRLADGQTLWNGVLLDITAKRRLEEQVRHAQKMDAIGRMAGGIAHDFNNLMTGVIGNLSRVQVPADDPNAPLIRAAEAAAGRAADLTRKMLGFARQNQLVVKPVRAGEIVHDALGLIRRTLDPRIHVVTELDDLGVVTADADLLGQSVVNLCLNARDAMPDGGTVTLRVESVQIDPASCLNTRDARPGPFVRLTVQDTGSGMSPEVQARAFEPFYTTKPVGEGTGLGLSMVQGIVEQHRGWIECRTTPGRGTRFDLYLPRTITDTNHAIRPAARAAGLPLDVVTPAPVGSRTILLVDDEEIIRTLGRSVLEGAGYKVIEAQDGADAVNQFRGAREQIDLIVLDLIMPRLSGRDAFRSILAIDPAVRVLFSSGYSPDDVSEIAPAAGLLAKPYRPQDLLAAVHKALQNGPPVRSPVA